MRAVLLTLTVCLCALPANAKYSGGTGEPNDPYQIATVADLIALGETPDDYDKHFILTADIDLDPNLPGCKVFDKAVIAPDTDSVKSGFQGTSFTGVFDGNGHTISHVTIIGKGYLGLFGQLAGKVTNLGVVDVNISGSADCVGGLAGNNGGTVTQCYATGAVTGNNMVGGLVGSSDESSVTECYSTGMVSGTEYVGGLVGYNSYCSVTRCFSTSVVSGQSSVGGLVGSTEGDDEYGSVVTQCYAAGVVSGNECVGGLVGYNYYCNVTRCFSTSVVSGQSSVGGLVGYNRGGGEYGSVTQCYAAGVVSGNERVGGLVGDNGRNVTQCYSTGAVDGEDHVGGLIGYLADGSVADSYSTGAVGGTGRNVGGLVGSDFVGRITACFWDTQTSGQGRSAGGIGRTTVEMQTVATFRAWGTCGKEGIWTMDEGRDYPRLRWQNRPGEPIVFERSLRDVLAGQGTEQSPYLIQRAEELNLVGLFPCDWDKHFKLMADLDLSAFDGKDGRPTFNTIGDCYRGYCNPELYCPNPVLAGSPFTGVLDGNGHTISHLRVNVRSRFGGLLSGLGGRGQVKNLGVVDVNVTSSFGLRPDSPDEDFSWYGYSYPAGGLVGYNDGGTLTNCYTTGVVRGIGSAAGGLVGFNRCGTVTQCYSRATVSGSSCVGGLLGETWGWCLDAVTDCYSTGVVSGGSNVGGLVGRNDSQMSRCYSTGVVDGNGNVGGLVGYNDQGGVAQCYSTGAVTGNSCVGGLVGDTWNGGVTHCYSTGAVSGNEYVGGLAGMINETTVTHCYGAGAVSGKSGVGGLVGYNDKGTVTNCFWDTETSGQATSDGGTGKTTAEMQMAKTFLDAGWDFVGETANGTEDLWKIAEGLDYPRLWWETAEE